jgi:hypothetical protein
MHAPSRSSGAFMIQTSSHPSQFRLWAEPIPSSSGTVMAQWEISLKSFHLSTTSCRSIIPTIRSKSDRLFRRPSDTRFAPCTIWFNSKDSLTFYSFSPKGTQSNCASTSSPNEPSPIEKDETKLHVLEIDHFGEGRTKASILGHQPSAGKRMKLHLRSSPERPLHAKMSLTSHLLHKIHQSNENFLSLVGWNDPIQE